MGWDLTALLLVLALAVVQSALEHGALLNPLELSPEPAQRSAKLVPWGHGGPCACSNARNIRGQGACQDASSPFERAAGYKCHAWNGNGVAWCYTSSECARGAAHATLSTSVTYPACFQGLIAQN